MSNFNYASVATTSSSAAISALTLTASAVVGVDFQIVGFDGSSSDQPFAVKLILAGSTYLTMQGSADTTVGRDFGEIGPVAGLYKDAAVEIIPAASGQCNVNLIYRRIK